MDSNHATGKYYDAKSSKVYPCQLILNYGRLLIKFDEEHENLHYNLSQIKIESRIADLPRSVYFDDGARFVTENHDFIDKYLRQERRDISFQLENNPKFLLISSVSLIAFILFSYFVIIPASASLIAELAPKKWAIELGNESENFLLENYFDSYSKVKPETLQKLKDRVEEFQNLVPHTKLNLIVESSKKIGANAFALPNGSIIVTDQIVEKTEDFEELSAVLLHEVGHIYHNHSMQRLITNSILSLIIFVVIGPTDFGSIPLLLMYGDYSREAELEADRFAGTHLLKQGKDPLLLTKLLKRINQEEKASPSNMPEFLLSHPHTETREQYLRQLKLDTQ